MTDVSSNEGDGRGRISERAYQTLRGRILEGEFKPGVVMSERALAEALDASRTPLRAAVARLEGEGLVARNANGSILIRSITVEDLLEILAIRELLETEAAALAAKRPDLAAIERLQREARTFGNGGRTDVELFWQHDDAFHAAIARMAGRSLLATLIVDLRGKARMCNVARMPMFFADQTQEHLDVLEALAEGDAKRARKAMARHFAKVRKRFLTWLSKH